MPSTHVELWDVDSGNLVGSFDDLDVALTFLRGAADKFGADVLNGYMLARSASDRDPLFENELLALVAKHHHVSKANG